MPHLRASPSFINCLSAVKRFHRAESFETSEIIRRVWLSTRRRISDGNRFSPRPRTVETQARRRFVATGLWQDCCRRFFKRFHARSSHASSSTHIPHERAVVSSQEADLLRVAMSTRDEILAARSREQSFVAETLHAHKDDSAVGKSVLKSGTSQRDERFTVTGQREAGRQGGREGGRNISCETR